jgi:hypothetical protein
VRTRSSDHFRWSPEQTLPVDGSGGLALASTFTELIIVARSASGHVQCMKYDLLHGWSPAESPASTPVATLALASFAHETKIMLALRDDSGAVFTRVRGGGTPAEAWSESVPVDAARSDGAIVLGTLGESLYLIVKAPHANSMNMISYNSAPFNTVTVEPNKYGGPQDETTVNAWSPSAFPVTHFSGWPDVRGQRQPFVRPYETSGPMAIATLDGVMHLVHPGVGNPLLMTETFSISGVMTPAKPVSYKNADVDVNNGFGTLAEARWSHQSPIFDARCEQGGSLAMGRAGNQIVLVYRRTKGSGVELLAGQYVRKQV